MAPSYLTFSLKSGMLRGSVGNRSHSLSAFSGRGRSQFVDSRENVLPTSSGQQLSAGRYTVAPPEHHPRLGLAARLTPKDRPESAGCEGLGLYIRAPGPESDDGIMAASGTAFQTLMQGLKTSGGGELVVWP
jgi:hypothetical protein